jgi:hypothetical protein
LVTKKDVTARLEDVQQDLIELIFTDTILVGQYLQSDLKALRVTLPLTILTIILDDP